MARRKQTVVQRIAIIGGTLIAFEAAYLTYHYMRQPKVLTIRDAIQKAVDKLDGQTPQRMEQARIQLAIADYMTQHEGKPPASLQELIPKYFDVVPIDPESNEPFPYKVDGKKYFIGKATTLLASSKGSPADADLSEADEAALIKSLSEPAQTAQFVYDPTGKRDPFAPFDFTPKAKDGEQLTPLERFSLGQLKLTAVLKGFDEPAAIVEDQSGRGYTVKKGTKIGTDGGEVVEIQPDKLLILETTVDFTGEKKTRTVEMKMIPKSEAGKDNSGSKGSTRSRR